MAAVALNGAGGFAFWWLAARMHLSTDVGASQELFSAVMAITCLTSMGLPVAVARYSVDGSVGAANFFRWASVYTALTSFVGVALLLTLAPDELLRPVEGLGRIGAAATLAAVIVGMSLAVLVEVRLMALRRWGWVVVRVLFVIGLRLPLLWVNAAGPSTWLFVLVAGAPAVSGLAGAAVLHRAGAGRFGWWRHLPADAGASLRYSTVHHLGLVGAQGPMFLVPLVVALRIDSSSYAAFYIAWAVTQTAFVIPHMLGQTFLVETAKRGFADAGHQRLTLALALGTMTSIWVASVVIASALGASLGVGYAAVGTLLPWLLLGCIPWAVTSTVLAHARLHHESSVVVLVTTAFFVGTIGGVALLAPNGGGVGAAEGWLLGNVVAAALACGLRVARRRERTTWTTLDLRSTDVLELEGAVL